MNLKASSISFYLGSILYICCSSTKNVDALNFPLRRVLLPAGYGLYSFAVDRHARRVVERMKQVPPPQTYVNSTSTTDIQPSQLRETFSKRNLLVTKPEDRMKWNKWLPVPADKAIDIPSLCGKYFFKYRSYVNFEEVSAYCKPFFNWRRFGFILRAQGAIKIAENPISEKQTNEEFKNGALAFVTLKEEFFLGGIIPLDIEWLGKVVENSDDQYCVDWKYTELRINLLLKKIIVENPEVSTKLSALNWDIVKEDDGMICFRRGDIGYLAYDSK